MKYAILIILSYPPGEYGISKIPPLQGAIKDLLFMTRFCLEREILPHNITIVTDLVNIPSLCNNTNIKVNPYCSSTFVCREFCQFIENTIRGIDNSYRRRDEVETPEVLIYFSCHGAKIPIAIPEVRDEQGIVLMNEDGTSLRYLTTKDIFNVLFGRNNISPNGIMKIPIYKKIKQIINENRRNIESISSDYEFISVNLTTPIESPNSEKRCYRSSYLMNRGIPATARVLIIVDTCYSGRMMHFPFIYSPTEQILTKSNLFGCFVNHIDMPYCVCISSCDADKSTKSPFDGSHLTQIICSQFSNCTESLNIMQFYYHIMNTTNSKFRNFIIKETISPVISSTSNNIVLLIPFFGHENIRKPRKIKKS